MTGFPWAQGDLLLANDLNAAIANAGSESGGAVNVLAYGADPTGVADSSAAINAAASQVAPNGTHKAIYLPAGTYRVNNQINLTACQGMYGDSRGNSVLYVDQAFSAAAAAVIFCTSGAYDPGPVLHDFGITFAQPSDQGTRANFKTLAAGGTSATGGTGVAYPWAIASGSDSFRIQIVRVRIAGAWDGITTNGHNTVYWLDDVEIGALDCGVSMGEGANGVQDFAHINQFHFWNFGLGSTLTNVYTDGQTVALRVGRSDGLNITGFSAYYGRIVFVGSAYTMCHIANCMLDGDGSTIEILGAGISHLNISNIYSSKGTAPVRPVLTVSAPAIVNIGNLYSFSSANYPDFLVSNASAVVSVTNFRSLYYTTSVAWATVSAGNLRITNGVLFVGSPRTVAAISETSNGSLALDNVDIQGGTDAGAGPIVSVVNVSSDTIIGRLALDVGNTWTFSLPAGLTTTHFSPNENFNGTLNITGGIFTDFGIQMGLTGGPGVNLGLVGAAGSQKAVVFYQGASIAWALASTDANDDFQILRYNNAGVYQGMPLSILRSNGAVSLGALPSSASYANDAAAAAGGVVVGQLYRNGSVMQVRVS